MTDPSASISPIEQRQAKQVASQILANQVASADRFTEETEEAFNPAAVEREQGRFGRFRPLNTRKKEIPQEGQKIQKVGTKSEDDLAQSYQRRNNELPADLLRRLRLGVQRAGSLEEVLESVMDALADPSLADEALEYLEQTTTGQPLEYVRGARNYLNETRRREIVAGQNVDAAAKAYYQKGIGSSPTELRNLYREITGDPKDHNTLFAELSKRYNFDELKQVVSFLLKGLGFDFKSKGPSIQQAELIALMTETRNLQSILWVYLFFRGRMKLIRRLYKEYEEEEDEEHPKRPSFETLAKEFIKLIEDRYPSVAKLLTNTEKMGLTESGQIITLMQYRDAIRELAPRVYRSVKHRQDLLMLIVEALEQLEEEEEEDESL